MKTIHFSDIGVPVHSIKEMEEIISMYEALGIEFAFDFENHIKKAIDRGFRGRFFQASQSNIKTKNTGDISVSLIAYQIEYVIDSINFAIAYQLLKTNQEGELIAHLNKYCKEYSNT